MKQNKLKVIFLNTKLNGTIQKDDSESQIKLKN